MSQFEEMSCKVLGVILFLIICLLVVQLNGCTCYDVPPPPSDYIDEVNVGAVMKLARQAAEAGVKRFIFISSIGVLGGYTKEPFNEDMPGNPCSQYGKSKLKAENLLRELSLEDRIDIVIIRPVLVYGEGAPGNFSKLLTMIKKTPLLPFGACFNKRSFISVSNLVDFIKICVTHPKAKNEIFCISDGNDISIKEFTNAISEGLNKNIIQTPVPTFLLRFMAKLIKQDSKIEQLIGDLQVDITKAQRLLGWSPPETMRETMKKLSR